MLSVSISAQFRMADRLAEGRLAEIITAGRAEGKSFEVIARDLYTDHGVEVTAQTVWNWHKRLTDDATGEVAS